MCVSVCACVYVCVSVCACRTSSSLALLDRIGGMNGVLVLRTSRKELDRGKREDAEPTVADERIRA